MLNRLIAVALAGAALVSTYAAAQPVASYRFKQIRQDMVVDTDGRRTITTSSQLQVLTAAGATQLAQFPVPYEGMNQDVEVLEAYTLKADGRKLTVDPTNVISQRVPLTNPLLPIYSDAEQKIVIFPNVEAGDTLFLTNRISDKNALMPGQYASSLYLTRAIESDDAIYTLTAPKAMHMTVASHEVNQDVTDHGDTTVYRWSFSNPTIKVAPATLVSNVDNGAYFIASSMKDYDAFARALGAVIRPKVAVTPEIQKRADVLTAGITDRKEQARAIYNWINQHVRYVAIYFGNGGIIPHDPNWTLNNAFGDCKDQAVLFASLLKAKNIPADLVLINATNRYKLSSVPSLGNFNHMIAYLPDWKIYTDTTVADVPFQMLPVQDYGRPVVHLVETGPAQHKIPVLPPDLVSSTYKVHAVENSDGRFDVQATISATGPWAGSLRQLATLLTASGPTTAAGALLRAHGFPNATGTLTAAANSTASGTETINGTFRTAGRINGGNAMALTRGLQILSRAGDGPIGPLANTTITASDETPCYSVRQTEDIDFVFAGGDHLAAVPSDTHIHTGNIAYDAKWTVSGNTTSLHREFSARINEPTCSGKVREDAADALAKIRTDYEQQAKIERPAAKAD